VVSAVRTGAENAVDGTAGAVGGATVGQFGTLTLNANGTYTYVVNDANAQVNALNQNQTLQERFTYTINDGADGNLGADTAELVITIQGQNDRPTVVAAAPSGGLVEDGGVANGTAGTRSSWSRRMPTTPMLPRTTPLTWPTTAGLLPITVLTTPRSAPTAPPPSPWRRVSWPMRWITTERRLRTSRQA
jgi:VCBS repeat-containing protein